MVTDKELAETIAKITDILESKALDSSLSKKDEEFLSEMIPHHKAALVMVKKLGASNNASVRKLAGSIQKAQTKEIAQMEKILGKKVAVKKSHGE